MANSIEGRFPFTTKTFMNYCFSIHSSEKLDVETGELKLPSKIAYQNILPKELLTKVKTGWTAPFGHWLSNNEKVQNFFQKSIGHTGPKTYKRMFRKFMFNDWKQKYNIV